MWQQQQHGSQEMLGSPFFKPLIKQIADTCEGVFAIYLLSSFGVNHSK